MQKTPHACTRQQVLSHPARQRPQERLTWRVQRARRHHRWRLPPLTQTLCLASQRARTWWRFMPSMDTTAPSSFSTLSGVCVCVYACVPCWCRSSPAYAAGDVPHAPACQRVPAWLGSVRGLPPILPCYCPGPPAGRPRGHASGPTTWWWPPATSWRSTLSTSRCRPAGSCASGTARRQSLSRSRPGFGRPACLTSSAASASSARFWWRVPSGAGTRWALRPALCACRLQVE